MNIKVYAGGTLAYDNLFPAEKGYTMHSILIRERINTGGSATLLLPPGHPLREGFSAFKTPVEIYRNGVLRWRGRALPESRDFYCRGKITCEGELCFLQDSTLRPGTYSGEPAAVFSSFINTHNKRVEEWKRFAVGNITVTADENVEVKLRAGQKTYAAVQDLVATYGGIILFDSAPDGTRRINWYREMPYSCNQRIALGVNLTDYSSSVDATGFATRIVPYGAEDAEGNPITINIDGKDYVESADGIAQRGIIEKSVTYPDITDPEELRAAAQRDVDKSATLPETIRLSALDISRQNLGLETFRMGQRVSAESAPHKLSGFYDLVAMEEDLVSPGAGSITLTKDAAYYTGTSGSLTGSVSSQNKELQDKPGAALIQSMIVTLTATILGAKGGAVRLLDTDGDGLQDTLYIGDNADPAKAKKVWRFNYEGWATSKSGYNGPFIMGATIKDGLLAASVTAANLVAGYIQSKDGKTFFLDLDKGILRANFTELSITGKTVDDIAQEKADAAEDNAVGQASDLADAAAKAAVDAQTQLDIFNKLTKNGLLQGLYMKNDDLYINASYIKSGKIISEGQTYLRPTYEDCMNMVWSLNNPAGFPPKDFYDLNGDGAFTITDVLLALNVCYGKADISECVSLNKSTVKVTIDPSNPLETLEIAGVNMWGSEVKVSFGANKTAIPVISGNCVVGGRMSVNEYAEITKLAVAVGGEPKTLSWKDNGDGTFTPIGR